jgi:hypothetical protein
MEIAPFPFKDEWEKTRSSVTVKYTTQAAAPGKGFLYTCECHATQDKVTVESPLLLMREEVESLSEFVKCRNGSVHKA